MKNENAIISLLEKIDGYKKLYFFNAFLRGVLISLLVLLASFLVINSAEYWGRFPSLFRTFLFFTFISLSGYLLFKYIAIPLFQLAKFKSFLSDEKAADQIGGYFPQIKDKLINVVQLNKYEQTELGKASLIQRSSQMADIQFTNAIDLNQNIKYLKWLIVPLFLAIFFYFYLPGFFTESTNRLIRFRTEFTPPPPFQFILNNSNLEAFKNEDVTVSVKLEGNSLPDQVYIQLGKLRHKMELVESGIYSYTIPSVSENQTIRFEAGGYFSNEFDLLVKNKPLLTGFSIQITPPSYTGIKAFNIKNTGNLSVPQGSNVKWIVQSEHTDAVSFLFPDGNKSAEKKLLSASSFEFDRKIMSSGSYTIKMESETTSKPNEANYDISVISDALPQISLRSVQDSISYSYIAVSGQISDDYGFNKLLLHYRKVNSKSTETRFNILSLKFTPTSVSQNYYQYLPLDTLQLIPGERVEYFVEIWDNDQINGSKAARTGINILQLPSKKELIAEIEKFGEEVEKQLETSLEMAKDLQKELKKIDSKIKSKKTLNWQDKKQIEDALKKHEDLKNALEELKEKNEKLNEKSNTVSEKNEKIAEKSKMLEELMKNVLDEETKKLYEELQKLMQEKSPDAQIQQQMEKIQKKDVDIEKELDRALEMFKQLQFEQKLDVAIDDLKKLAEEQQKLAEETEKMDQKSESSQEKKEELAQKQKELNQKLDEQKEALKDLKEMNKDLENPNDLDEKASEDLQEAGEDQKKGSESLEKNNKKDASKSQKSAADKMKKAAEKMAKAKSEDQKEQAAENIKDLKQILDNLLTLSFNQEQLMKELKVINQQDPNYLKLTQSQLKIKDDSKIIEDSLTALAKRVHQIKSFVTREVTGMQNYIDESIKSVRQRRPDVAAGKGQFAMTSMNNLALMLNEVLSKMQDEQQDGKATGGMMCKKPGKKGKPASLGNLQKQLSQRIEQLQKSGMSGKALSKELAKMAAEQEMLRNSLKDLEGGKEGEDGKNGSKAGSSQQLKELAKKMEENEKDLVNKKITQETILRQNEILTRLLEAEKAKRERETENRRESNTGKLIEKPIPPSLENYLKEKEKQIELLRTIPPSLTPYYKKEVNEYFQKLQN